MDARSTMSWEGAADTVDGRDVSPARSKRVSDEISPSPEKGSSQDGSTAMMVVADASQSSQSQGSEPVSKDPDAGLQYSNMKGCRVKKERLPIDEGHYAFGKSKSEVDALLNLPPSSLSRGGELFGVHGSSELVRPPKRRIPKDISSQSTPFRSSCQAGTPPMSSSSSYDALSLGASRLQSQRPAISPSVSPPISTISLIQLQTDTQTGHTQLYHSGNSLPASKIKLLKRDQRTSMNMWATSWAYPAQPVLKPNVLDRQSVCVAPKWLCLGVLGCDRGDCMSQLQSVDVHNVRRVAKARTEQATSAGKVSLSEIVRHDLSRCYDARSNSFGYIQVQVDEFTSVELCASAYGLCLGLIGSTFYTHCVRPLQKGEGSSMGTHAAELIPLSKQDQKEKLSHDYVLIKAWIRSLRSKYEQEPAPGAATNRREPGDVTIMTKQSWPARWAACQKHFASTMCGYTPGSIDMLKRAWLVRDHSLPACSSHWSLIGHMLPCLVYSVHSRPPARRT